MINDIGNFGLSAIQKITDLWRASKSDSLIDYTSPSRVEPVLLIDANATYSDLLPMVNQSLLSIFAGYYLQAVAISTTVGKVNVGRELDRFQPKRNPVDNAANSLGYLMATESYRWKLPTNNTIALEAKSNNNNNNNNNAQQEYNEAKLKLDYAKFDFDAANVYIKRDQDKAKMDMDKAKMLAEDARTKAQAEQALATYNLNKEKMGNDKAMAELKHELEKAGLELRQNERNDRLSAYEMSIGRDTLSTIKEQADLSVGKMMTVEITDGLHKATIPVNVRLKANLIAPDNLVNVLALGNKDNSAKERFHGWLSGNLSGISDMVFCQDLIDAHRKNLMNDKDGIYTQIMARRRGNQISTLLSGNPSVATASNLVILTNDTAAKLENEIHGKLADFRTREKIFKETYIMIMVVIDTRWDTVTFYHRGIEDHTRLGRRDMKSSSSNGPDVSEILKAYQMGSAPSL
jgi:hypothetical protein